MDFQVPSAAVTPALIMLQIREVISILKLNIRPLHVGENPQENR